MFQLTYIMLSQYMYNIIILGTLYYSYYFSLSGNIYIIISAHVTIITQNKVWHGMVDDAIELHTSILTLNKMFERY